MPVHLRNSECQSWLWGSLGILSSIVGLVSFALSSSFKLLFGEWKFYKFLLYFMISLIICGLVLFPKKIQVSSSFCVAAHVGFSGLMLTSLYSFFYDKALKGNPDVLGIVSYAALAFMSLCLLRQFKLGFEVGFFYFFPGCVNVEMMKIHPILAVLATVFSYSLIFLRSYLDSQDDSGTTGSGENVSGTTVVPENATVVPENREEDRADSDAEILVELQPASFSAPPVQNTFVFVFMFVVHKFRFVCCWTNQNLLHYNSYLAFNLKILGLNVITEIQFLTKLTKN